MGDRPLRLVIADDNEDARILLSRVFDALEDFDVLGEAADLSAATELVERHQPDVALLDRAMPGMTGPEAIENLRRRSPGTAVVMVSGYARNDREAQPLARVVDGFVQKGTPTTALVAAIRRAAQGSRRAAPPAPPSRPAPRTGRPPSLQELAAALHDGPVQALSGALWTLEARRRELLARLRTSLRSALQATRAITRWAEPDDGE
jgi:DNA-binding NarL/FixJ family response regulator